MGLIASLGRFWGVFNSFHNNPVRNLTCVSADIASICSELKTKDYRNKVAQWLPIGKVDQNFMSHHNVTDLLRAFTVLTLCNIVANRSQQLFALAISLGPLPKWILRKTFYNQFVVGETIKEMQGTIENLIKNQGLRVMFLPVMESTMDETSVENINDVLDKNEEIFCHYMKTLSILQQVNTKYQLKISALIPPHTLELLTNRINVYIQSNSKNVLQSKAKLIESILKFMSADSTSLCHILKLDAPNLWTIERGLLRLDSIIRLASILKVQILIDAEYTAWKEAIALITQSLMVKFNGAKDFPLVGSTTQAYLKDSDVSLLDEWSLMIDIFRVSWAGKIVRGAYLDHERTTSEASCRSSPVWDTYEKTNESYNTLLCQLMTKMSKQNGSDPTSHLVVATHNEKSIRLAVHLAHYLGINCKQQTNSSRFQSNYPTIAFAQIYGMADYISIPLAKCHYAVYKSTPFGNMEKVLPYLSRRALENRSVLTGIREEAAMLKLEIWRRISN